MITTLILTCMVYNTVSPENYFKEIDRINTVHSQILVLEEPNPVVKVKKNKSWYDKPQWWSTSYRANRIREISREIWYKNPELAVKIAMCESWLDPNAKNKYSSAWWLFQQLWRYRPERAKRYWFSWASRFDWEANAYVSISMLRDWMLSHWNESKWCRWW